MFIAKNKIKKSKQVFNESPCQTYSQEQHNLLPLKFPFFIEDNLINNHKKIALAKWCECILKK